MGDQTFNKKEVRGIFESGHDWRAVVKHDKTCRRTIRTSGYCTVCVQCSTRGCDSLPDYFEHLF